MKYRVCQRGWEYAQIWSKEGEVSVCSWGALNYKPSIGRLSEKSIEEIWHGDDAKIFRESLLDGSYRFCEKEKCPWIANGTLEEHMIEVDGVADYPAEVSLSYERMCNYDCTCCETRNYTEGKEPDAEEKRNKIENELKKFIDNVHTISANGRGELFTSPHIMKMLAEWKPNRPGEEIHVVLETNGSLFDEAHWKKIENLGQYDLKVSITLMGIKEDTYQFLSGCKYPISKMIDNLKFVSELRKKGIVNDYEIGTVIQERNFREMPELTRRCIEEFGVDRVRHRPYFPWGEKYTPTEKWFFDIRNPFHPYYPEYKKIFTDPIFQHPKVLMWSGEELSNQGRDPGEKDRMNFDVIKEIAANEELPDRLRAFYEKNKIAKIVLYGFGYVGQAFLNVNLRSHFIEISQIIDSNQFGREYRGYCIKRLEDYVDEEDVFVVAAPFFFEEIRKTITDMLPQKRVLNISDVINSSYD